MRRPKVKHSEESPVSSSEHKRDIKQTDKTILDNFYKLVNTQGHVRLTAALSTFKILAAMRKNNTEKFNEHLNYCVERLVTGLASPRALARRGYATLLLEILTHYQFSTDRLLSIAQKKFGSIPHESKDNLVGYYLLITIILESDNYKSKANKANEYAEKLHKLLHQLKVRKSYFDFPVNKLLVRYHDVFRPFMAGDDILDRLADPPASALGKHVHTHLTESLFNDCSKETLEAYLVKLINTFSRHHTPETRKVYAFCAKQMTRLVRRLPSDLDPNSNVTHNHDSTTKIGKFLIVNGLFSSIDSSKVPKSFWSKHGVLPAVDFLHVSTKKALKSAYHSTLDHIVSTCDAQKRLELMQDLIHFADTLIKHQAVNFPGQDGKIALQWADYTNSYKELRFKEAHPKILYPITSLYLLYGFQILEHGLESEEQLKDLAQSATEALKDDPNDGTWADVLTDQIIAILSATECNPWIRRLCVSVFGSLLPHISETSVDLICDVFKTPIVGPDDGDEDDSEEDDDSEAMDCTADDTQDKDEPANESSCEEEDDEDDDEDDDDVSDDDDRLPSPTDGHRKSDDNEARPSKSSGEQEVSDDDDEEEEYLDDEQMMKLDSVLADMFRMNRVGKKKKDPSFQLRCLDLVKKILQKKHNDGELIRKVLATIVPFASKCRRHKETRAIAEKVRKMIEKMPGKAHLIQKPGQQQGQQQHEHEADEILSSEEE